MPSETSIRAPRLRLTPPSTAGRTIARPRLMARLERARDAAVTTVVAPAGFGKTSLIVDWLATTTGPVAWVSLDEADDDPSRLVETILAAVGMAGVASGARVRPLLRADQPAPAHALGEALARDLADAPAGLVLVLDDLQHLRSAGAYGVIGGLIAAQPANRQLHLVLASRNDPGGIADRGRLGDRLVDIRASDLRLDRPEAGAVAARLQPPPGPDLVDRAFAASHGWPAAFRLMLTGGQAAPLADVEQSIDWLVESACGTLHPDLVERLTHGSVAEHISDELLGHLAPGTGDAGSMADVPLVDALAIRIGDGTWRRLHPLLRESLRRRLRTVHGDAATRAANLAASQWFEQAGDMIQAIRHALAAGDQARAGLLIETAGIAALNNERWDHLAALLDLVPESLDAVRPGLLALRCWRSYSLAGPSLGEEIATARRLIEGWPEAAEMRRWSGHFDVLETFILPSTPPVLDMIARTTAILRILPDSDTLARGILVATTGIAIGMQTDLESGRGYLLRAIADAGPRNDAYVANTWSGLALLAEHLGEVASDIEAPLTAALAVARAAELSATRVFADIGLGWLALQRLDLARANEFFADAASIKPGPLLEVWRKMRAGQALVAALSGDAKLAEEIGDDIVRVSSLVGRADNLAHSRAFQARIMAILGRFESVQAWLRDPGDRMSSVYFLLHEWPDLDRQRFVVAMTRPDGDGREVGDAAIDQLRKLPDATQGPAWCRAGAAIVSAIWWWHTDRRDEAVDALLPVAEAAARLANHLLLVEHGEAIGPLVDACEQRGLDATYAAAVRAGIDRLATIWPDPMRMTPREREVLAMMALPLTFDEIGAQLFVSPATVRWHAHNIYRRLGVARRRLAVERGRALGLVTG